MARLLSGGSDTSVRVDDLAILDMSDNLRAMFKSAQSPLVLRDVYSGPSEHLYQVSSSQTRFESWV